MLCIIHNSFKNLLVEASIGISYESDPDRAIELIKNVLEHNDAVSEKLEPQVGIQNFADSAIEIVYRYWVPTKNYYQVQHQINRDVFNSFRSENIIIPFPQQDVRIVQTN